MAKGGFLGTTGGLLLTGGASLPTYLADKKKSGGSAASPLASPQTAKPVGVAAPAVVQAEHDFAQQNLLKKSIKGTILAGDTGGYDPYNPGKF